MGGESALGTRAGDVFTKITVITALIWIALHADLQGYEPPKTLDTAGSSEPSLMQGGQSEEKPEVNPRSMTGSAVFRASEAPEPQNPIDDGAKPEDAPEKFLSSTPDEPESYGEETGDGNSDQWSFGTDGVELKPFSDEQPLSDR